MHKKKRKTKARRRAKKLQERAWEEVDNGNLDMAVKLLRQALAEGNDNPSLWNDWGLIQDLAGDGEEAEKAFRNAILIAPAYAEAYANLAAFVARRGRTIQAARLQRQAVEKEPNSEDYRQRLAAYEALLPEETEDVLQTETPVPAQANVPAVPDAPAQSEPLIPIEEGLRFTSYDWDDVERQLAEDGCVLLKGLLSPEECEDLIALYPQRELFEKTVFLSGESGGGGSYRFFRTPLPDTVGELRAGVYARLVSLANRWQGFLERPERWPATHQGFLEQCAAEGQERNTPILLRYRAPAENRLHQDVWGRVYFPFQLAVTLSARDESFQGGAFVMEEGVGRQARRIEVPTSQGDAVIFCTRERLVPFGQAWAVRSVRHGMGPLTAGERYVVGIPFHSYK